MSRLQILDAWGITAFGGGGEDLVDGAFATPGGFSA